MSIWHLMTNRLRKWKSYFAFSIILKEKSKEGGHDMNPIVINQGNEKNLWQELERYDTMEISDCIVRKKEKITVEFTRKKDNTFDWVMKKDLSDFSSNACKKGKGIKSFMKQFEGEDVAFGYNTAVLVHKRTDPEKTFKNSIISTWYYIPIYAPLEEDEEGRNYIAEMEFEFNPKEYRAMMETRIAILDERTSIFYPLQRIAIPSVAKYLEANGLFRLKEEFLIGAGLFLAEKIRKRNIQLIVRKLNENMYPIMSAGGKYANLVPPKVFIKQINDYLGQSGLFYLEDWKSSDDRIMVNWVQSGTNYGISFLLGIIPGVATRAMSFYSMKGRKIYLKVNTISRFDMVDYELDPKRILKGLIESFPLFDEYWKSENMDLDCRPSKETKCLIKTIPDKKRNIYPKIMNKREFFVKLATEQYSLNFYNDYKFSEYLGVILKRLAGGNQLCTGETKQIGQEN